MMFPKTAGQLEEDGISITFGGGCPVQGDGIVDGYPCYYRSRGEGWQFHVAFEKDGDPLDEEAWVYRESPYKFPDGGWVPPHVSIECIRKAVTKWRDEC